MNWEHLALFAFAVGLVGNMLHAHFLIGRLQHRADMLEFYMDQVIARLTGDPVE